MLTRSGIMACICIEPLRPTEGTSSPPLEVMLVLASQALVPPVAAMCFSRISLAVGLAPSNFTSLNLGAVSGSAFAGPGTATAGAAVSPASVAGATTAGFAVVVAGAAAGFAAGVACAKASVVKASAATGRNDRMVRVIMVGFSGGR